MPVTPRRRFALACAAALAALVVLAPSAQAARGIELGLTDSVFQTPEGPGWIDRADDAGAQQILLGAVWSSIAPGSKPSGFDARNPGDPAYSWGGLDDAVREATARGLTPMIQVGQAPAWAEGPNRPSTEKAPGGSWKPDPQALADFGVAIAKRYSGSFTDPADVLAGPLPKVSRYQLWAEPNLGFYLSPQWKKRKPVGPNHYRLMMNAFYDAVKSVNPGALVLTGGTAPYGDPGRRGTRMQPGVWWRALVKKDVRLDAAAVNPINVGGPTRHARNRDDISTPDIGKLHKILRHGRKHIEPGGKPPIWATEIWWDSRPPDPGGVGLRKNARWLAQSFYVLWKEKVKSVTWFLIRDQKPGGDFAASVQSGLYFADGKPKPALAAYEFPFVGDRASKSRVRVWGMAPGAGQVEIQRKAGGWKTVKRVNAGANRVFTGKIKLRGEGKIRAVSGGETSLAWKQGAG